jgi:hypothetical protein
MDIRREYTTQLFLVKEQNSDFERNIGMQTAGLVPLIKVRVWQA